MTHYINVPEPADDSGERVTVTVAPGQFVRLTPHPSGIAELRHLELQAGQKLTVSAQRAERLIASGLVLDPATGAVRPSPPTPDLPRRPIIQVTGSYEDAAARAELQRAAEAKPTRAFADDRLDSWREPVTITPRDPRTTPVHYDFGSGNSGRGGSW